MLGPRQRYRVLSSRKVKLKVSGGCCWWCDQIRFWNASLVCGLWLCSLKREIIKDAWPPIFTGGSIALDHATMASANLELVRSTSCMPHWCGTIAWPSYHSMGNGAMSTSPLDNSNPCTPMAPLYVPYVEAKWLGEAEYAYGRHVGEVWEG